MTVITIVLVIAIVAALAIYLTSGKDEVSGSGSANRDGFDGRDTDER